MVTPRFSPLFDVICFSHPRAGPYLDRDTYKDDGVEFGEAFVEDEVTRLITNAASSDTLRTLAATGPCRLRATPVCLAPSPRQPLLPGRLHPFPCVRSNPPLFPPFPLPPFLHTPVHTVRAARRDDEVLIFPLAAHITMAIREFGWDNYVAGDTARTKLELPIFRVFAGPRLLGRNGGERARVVVDGIFLTTLRYSLPVSRARG